MSDFAADPDEDPNRVLPGFDFWTGQGLGGDAAEGAALMTDDGDLIENEDGSVTVPEERAPVAPRSGSRFYENLAESLPGPALVDLGSRLHLKIDRDRGSWDKADEMYELGLRRTGMAGDAPGGANFDGASKVAHPMLTEACVDFAAAAYKELMPPDGPVKEKLRGKETRDKRARAERKSEYLNWQLTKQIEEYPDELSQLLPQLGMAGNGYLKFRYDDRLRRPRVEFVPQDDMIIPYAASSFYTAQRITHVIHLTEMEFEERVEDGVYVDDPTARSAPLFTERSAAGEASDDIEGREEMAYNEDGVRDVFECYAWWRLEDDPISGGRYAPYIISVDDHTQRVLAIYRNWREDDKDLRRLDWWVEWGFVVWRGARKIGFPQLIGGLAATATGALRALLDSAHVNNTPCAVKLRGGRQSGQDVVIDATQVSEIEAPPGVTDIRQLIMALPFNPPSPVLYELLGFVVAAGKGVVSTAEEKIAEASNQMPVGTTLALIEQGSKVASSIHARLHRSQAKALEILCRINYETLDDEEVLRTFGEQIVSRADFANSDNVQPVSDPTIFSEAQRFARMQAIQQMSQDPSVPWNKVNVYRDALQMMHVDDPDRYLPSDQPTVTADPVNENVAAVLQSAKLKADQSQDHVAHVREHMAFVSDPMQGGCPLVPFPVVQGILQHCVEHLVMLYPMLVNEASAAAVIGRVQREGPGNLDPDVISADSADLARRQMTQRYGQQFGALVQKAMQAVQSKAPPPPSDPAQLTFKAAMAETQRQQANDQAQAQLQREKMMGDLKTSMAELTQKLQTSMAEQRQDFIAKMAEVQQGYIELEQNAAKLGISNASELVNMIKTLHENVVAIEQRLAQANQGGAAGGTSAAPPQPASAQGAAA